MLVGEGRGWGLSDWRLGLRGGLGGSDVMELVQGHGAGGLRPGQFGCRLPLAGPVGGPDAQITRPGGHDKGHQHSESHESLWTPGGEVASGRGEPNMPFCDC